MSAPGRTVTPAATASEIGSPSRATVLNRPSDLRVFIPARMQAVSGAGAADAVPAVDRIAVEARAAAAARGRILMRDSFVSPECGW
ncbi:hypothetical protein GCM10009868_09140 [Terrabacter aerolatus]